MKDSQPAAQRYFAPVPERALYDAPGKKGALGFKSEHTMALPAGLRKAAAPQLVGWLRKAGLDVAVQQYGSWSLIGGQRFELTGVELAVRQITGSRWETITPAQVREILKSLRAKVRTRVPVSSKSNGACFVFRTRRGAEGVMSLVKSQAKRELVIRYKLLTHRAAPPLAVQPAAGGPRETTKAFLAASAAGEVDKALTYTTATYARDHRQEVVGLVKNANLSAAKVAHVEQALGGEAFIDAQHGVLVYRQLARQRPHARHRATRPQDARGHLCPDLIHDLASDRHARGAVKADEHDTHSGQGK